MTDSKTLELARLLFIHNTQGDMIAREVVDVAERTAKKAALWEEVANQKDKELATLRAQRDELWEQLTPLKDAVLYARAQRRPMGIGQDCPRGAPCACIEMGTEYGRERDSVGFWIGSDDVTDDASPSPCKRIALALIRLAYAVAEKVKPQP